MSATTLTAACAGSAADAAARPPDRGVGSRRHDDRARRPTTLHGGRLVARRLKAHGVTQAVHAVGRPPVLDLRRLPRRRASTSSTSATSRPPRSPPRAGRRSRASPASCALTAGPGVTNGMSAIASRAAEPLADARARRPRAGDALGPGLAAGDRPRAVRAAAGQARRDGRRRPPRSPAWSTRRWRRGRAPHTGPAFVDFPLDVVFMEAAGAASRGAPAPPRAARRRRRARSTARPRCCARPSGR